jgi:hypothetical protein
MEYKHAVRIIDDVMPSELVGRYQGFEETY